MIENNIDSKEFVMGKPSPVSDTNKKTSRAVELQRLLQYKLKFNVVEELIELYRSGDIKGSDQRQILSDLMKYLYPQLKAMEIDTRDGEKINVNIVFPDSTKSSIEKPIATVEGGSK
jgi:hypothetical protein